MDFRFAFAKYRRAVAQPLKGDVQLGVVISPGNRSDTIRQWLDTYVLT